MVFVELERSCHFAERSGKWRPDPLQWRPDPLNYHWTICPNCACQVAVNWSVRPEEVSGSVRRWSTDRSVNDGRPFVVPGAQAAAGLAATCVCGATIPLPERPDAVGGERADDLRVTLTAGD